MTIFTMARSNAVAILAALLLWQAAAFFLNQRILLVGPVDVLNELARQAPRPDFWLTVWFSLRRIFLGFFLALSIGMLLAALSYRFKVFKVMIRPYMSIIKATPVASIIILILIFMNSRNLSLIVSFLIVLPVVYANILEGLFHTDGKLIEMAGVFHAGLRKRIMYIYLPQLKPYLISACTASIGMAWKSGTAAEVIGIPKGSIGERLYEAKIYLSSSELFAWTLVIIVLSIFVEKLVLWLIAKSYSALTSAGGRNG
jgi:NitT/TauT family transport system permease protein